MRDIRRYGAPAIDLCAAAAGRMDADDELGLNPWDHAAGALVAAEAGLVVTGLPGCPFAEPMASWRRPSVAAPFVDLLARAATATLIGTSSEAAARAGLLGGCEAPRRPPRAWRAW